MKLSILPFLFVGGGTVALLMLVTRTPQTPQQQLQPEIDASIKRTLAELQAKK